MMIKLSYTISFACPFVFLDGLLCAFIHIDGICIRVRFQRMVALYTILLGIVGRVAVRELPVHLAFMTHPLSIGFVRNTRKKFIILHFLCIFQIFQAYFDRNSRKPSPPLFCKKVPIAGNAASAMGTFVGFCEMEIRRTRRR